VLEIIEERSKPISLFNGVRGDGVDFTLFWDKLQDSREEPSFFYSNLRRFTFWKDKCCSKLR
jgi:hypothetical protein